MANWWTLKILTGPEAGKTFTLKRDRSVIGRVKGDVVLGSDTELSSVHAEITFDAHKGCPILQDLRSRNGTRVNGEKIEKRALMPGDRVRFGITELVLEPPSAEETVAIMSPDFAAAQITPTSEAQSPAAPAARQAEGKPAPLNAVAAAVAAATAATAAAATKSEQAAQGKVVSERPSTSGGYSLADLLTGPSVFYGYFSRFYGILLHPTRFFDFLASENAIIDGDQAYRKALKFGALNWILGGVLSAVLSFYCTYVWKTTSPGVGYGSNPFAIAFTMLLGLFVLPIIAVVYHWICHALGGKGPFKVAVRILCYVSAVHLVKDLVGFLPKAGPFLTILFQAYTFYLLALGATRLYYVGMLPAIASFAASTAAAIALTVSAQHSSMTMQEQLVKLNPFLSKSIGASFVDANAPVVQQRDPASPQTPPAVQAHTEAAPNAAAPAAEATVKSDPSPPAGETTAIEPTAADPEAPTSSVTSDPTPPTSPTSPTSEGDPEPPKMPGN